VNATAAPGAHAALACLIAAAALVGCGTANQRVIRVTSDPPGARVWLNDTEIGVTPAEAAARFPGASDGRLRPIYLMAINDGARKIRLRMG